MSRLSESKLKYLCDVNWLEEQYLKKRMTDPAVGKLLGVCQDTARKYRILSYVKGRSRGGQHKSIESAWYTIDPYLCYLIGFIFADGFLGENGLAIELHKRDVDLLVEFKDRYGGAVRQRSTRQNRAAATWWLNRQKLTHCLVNNWGMTPGPKSQNMPPVPVLKEQLMPHFVRGYFDGDGCVFVRKTGLLTLNITCGDRRFLTAFRDSLPIQHRFRVSEHSNGTFRLCTSGKKARNFLDWMWADGQGFHLQRKWKGYINAL